ncbi:hypothetical protein [Rhodohalobacter sp. 614A]|uniref:hypothetical protein n=1 Tax=Rhodohalobacter sp. 614A TaxID=2908649 RepID=UPI001F189207|nr:hypothetical protein [Rhodohalobacter sp. 614A]
MKTEKVRIKNGAIELPEKVRLSMNLKDDETVLLELNEDGTVTLRKNDTIANLKGIIKKGETPEIQVNGFYNLQFETSSNGQGKQ